MATTRQTISFQSDLLDEAKEEAKAQDRSVSSLVNAYMRVGMDRDPVRRARSKTKPKADTGTRRRG